MENIRWSVAPLSWRAKTGPDGLVQNTKKCEQAMRDAFKQFCFDKIGYIACQDSHPDISRYLALRHKCGNCYSFALFLQQLLKSRYNLASYVIVGNVPVYYMRPTYHAICHAALYVPEAEAVLDPSIYAPPIPVAFSDTPPHHIRVCRTTPGTITYLHGHQMRANAVFRESTFRVSNPLNKQHTTLVPGNTYHLKVSLQLPGLETVYDYVLRGVQNFDASITKHVHQINTYTFRQQTDQAGRFTHSVYFSKDFDKVIFKNEQTGKEKRISVRSRKWRTTHTWTPAELQFLKDISYSCLY